MDELGAILRGLIAGEVISPHTLSRGALLAWSAKRGELLIARPNAQPKADEMAIFRRYIKQAGYAITRERPAEPIERSLNTYLGFALKLEPAKAPAPQAEQLKLIE